MNKDKLTEFLLYTTEHGALADKTQIQKVTYYIILMR